MIDTHAHLLMFEGDGRGIIDNMERDGLERIVTIGTTFEDSALSVELAERNKDVYAAVGIYPEYAETATEADFEALEKLAASEKVVAIGEIGLDYHSEGYDAKSQKRVFLRQIELADKLGLPFCIHCRGAAADVYQILSEHKNLLRHSALMHCYSEGGEWIEKFLGLGLYISFSGNITFKNADRSFLKQIPMEKILVETDSPYLAPVPLRGTKNEPKNVRFVIDKLAIELGGSPAMIEKITSENAKRFYYKMK